MKIVLQRVSSAVVRVDKKAVGHIGKGFLLFIGVFASDGKEEADRLAKKVSGLRIFEDEQGKTNLSLADVGGDVLAVSQFTLCADCRKGNRPSFADAGDPSHAEEIYEYFVKQLRALGVRTECGVFGADMKVSIENDGPFTLVLE